MQTHITSKRKQSVVILTQASLLTSLMHQIIHWLLDVTLDLQSLLSKRLERFEIAPSLIVLPLLITIDKVFDGRICKVLTKIRGKN